MDKRTNNSRSLDVRVYFLRHLPVLWRLFLHLNLF
jgi:hypothetical protein